jgi:type I restriction enzyme S subunit
MAILQPYKKYNAIAYDYTTQLPDGWQLLPNIAVFQERIERGYENEELLSVTIGRGVIKQVDLDKKDSSTLDKSKYLLVYPNDLVYSMRFRQGASGYSSYKGIVSPACTVLKPRKDIKYNPRYFHYMFRTGFYKNYAERYAYGIADGQMPLRYFDFKRMYSIVPPLEVQNSIVAFLDKKNFELDKFIRNKEKLIELLEKEKSSIILKLVTKGIDCIEFKDSNVNWIGKIPKHWKIKRLRFLCKITTGNRNTEDKRDDGEYPFFVRSQIVERINSYSFDGESILTAGDGAGVGKVFHYINGKFDYHQRVYNFYNFKTVIGLYLFYYIKTNFHNVALMGDAKSTVDSLRLPLIKDFEITYPTEIEEQKVIVNKIENECSTIDLAITKAQKEISSIKEYCEALNTDLVIGKRSLPHLQMS